MTINGGDESDVYVESLWNGTVANPHGFYILGGTWRGNVVCQTSGIMVGNSNTFHGRMWSNWDGQAAAAVYKLSIEIGHGVDVIPPSVRCEHANRAKVTWNGNPDGIFTDWIYAYFDSDGPDPTP